METIPIGRIGQIAAKTAKDSRVGIDFVFVQLPMDWARIAMVTDLKQRFAATHVKMVSWLKY